MMFPNDDEFRAALNVILDSERRDCLAHKRSNVDSNRVSAFLNGSLEAVERCRLYVFDRRDLEKQNEWCLRQIHRMEQATVQINDPKSKDMLTLYWFLGWHYSIQQISKYLERVFQ